MLSSFPATLHHYAIQSVLGEGHIGFVYRAINTLNGREVALKVLRADSPVPDARQYFQNERIILQQLNHPSIPSLCDYVDGEMPCLALRVIEGQDGEALLAGLPDGDFLSVQKVVGWGLEIADALTYLHDHDPPVIFRDLKPSHIMVDSRNRAWLVDFNLAVLLPPNTFSIGLEAIGTEGFNPPEQYNGIVSPLADIYALGATLHYLLTQINPRHERLFTYAPPRSVHPSIPKPVSQVIMKALAYEPEDRFQSMKDMRQALQKAVEAV